MPLPNLENQKQQAIQANIWLPVDKEGNRIDKLFGFLKAIFKGEARGVGHTSVHIGNANYASFWPNKPVNFTDVRGVKKPVPATIDVAYTRDKYEEGNREYLREPDLAEKFQTLDTTAMLHELEKMREDIKTLDLQYVGKPSFMITQFYGMHANCSSATYRLLRAGGINKLSDKCRMLEPSLTNPFLPISPMNLYHCVKDAKHKENELNSNQP